MSDDYRSPSQIILCQTLALCVLAWASLPWQSHPFVVVAMWVIGGPVVLWWGTIEFRIYERCMRIEYIDTRRAEIAEMVDTIKQLEAILSAATDAGEGNE